MKRAPAIALLFLLACDSAEDPGQATVQTVPSPAAGDNGAVALPYVAPVSGRVTPEEGGFVGAEWFEAPWIFVPPGAVDKELMIDLATVPDATYETAGMRVVGGVYRVRAGDGDHVAFAQPATIILPYDPERLNNPEHRAAIGLSIWDGTAWKRVPESWADVDKHTVQAQVDHFSDAAPTQDLPDSPDGNGRVTARWFASTNYRKHLGYSNEPGGFGEFFAGSSQDVETTIGLAWREQINLIYNGAETVVEEATWSSSVRFGAFELKNGQSLPGGPGGEGEGTIPEGSRAMLLTPTVEGTNVDLRPSFEEEVGFDVVKNTVQLKDDNLRAMEFEVGEPVTERVVPPTSGFPMVAEGRTDRDGNIYYTATDSRSWPAISERLGGAGEWSSTATVVKIVTPQTLAVKGRVIHRIHTAGAGDGLVPLPSEGGSEWAAIADRVIAPAGHVGLEMELVDGETGESLSGILPVSVDPAGRFEMRLPFNPKHLLRLKSVYSNEEAELIETCETELALGELTAPRPESGEWKIDLTRRYTAWMRYAGEPTEFALGSETRPVYVGNTRDGYIVEFKELGSLLVNTFVYTARHVNQNQAGFTIRGVHLPRQEILDTVPTDILPQWLIDGSLASLPPDDVTEVDVRGSEICFPSSTLMALDALGLEEATEPRVGEFAQSIYNLFPRPQPLPEGHTWWVPFPTEWVGPFGSYSPLPSAWLATWSASYWHWPYVTPSAKSKKWLITVRDGAGGTWRPWQVTGIVFPAVRAMYPGALRLESLGIDVFEAANRNRILSELGKGSVGTVSIAHLSQPGAQRGTHVLTFLGVVTDAEGNIVRCIFHDPYGDLTRTPNAVGFYRPSDVDPDGHWGRYVSYGGAPHPVNAYQGRIAGNYWNVYRPAEPPSVGAIRARLLPSDD